MDMSFYYFGFVHNIFQNNKNYFVRLGVSPYVITNYAMYHLSNNKKLVMT